MPSTATESPILSDGSESSLSDLPVEVAISESDLVAATDFATQTLRVFAGQPGYYNNSFNSHLRGKVGEIACANWFKSLGKDVERWFEEPSRISDADLNIVNHPLGRIEVKTWDTRWWADMGRCIAVNQLPSLQAKADAVIWCISPSVLESDPSIVLAGWSTLDDVASAPKRNTGPKNRRQVYNYQLDQDKLRDLSSFFD